MSNARYCPKHPYEKMSLLLVSYVCDICDPPKVTVTTAPKGIMIDTSGYTSINNNPRWWNNLDRLILSQTQFVGKTFSPNSRSVVRLSQWDDPLAQNVVMVVLIDVSQIFTSAQGHCAVAAYNWPSAGNLILDVFDKTLWNELTSESFNTYSPNSRHWKDHHESEMLGVEAYGNILGTILCKLV